MHGRSAIVGFARIAYDLLARLRWSNGSRRPVDRANPPANRLARQNHEFNASRVHGPVSERTGRAARTHRPRVANRIPGSQYEDPMLRVGEYTLVWRTVQSLCSPQ
jgi:hypothetical protein